jgi:hypothetical protein
MGCETNIPEALMTPETQPAALADLIDFEAAWENLPAALPPDLAGAIQGLRAKQLAYDAYRAKLVAYNARYRPAHINGSRVGTAERLAVWCRKTRDLLLLLEPNAPCPVHLMAKARRFADHLGSRKNLEPQSRASATDIEGAASEWEAMAGWCDGLVEQ